MEGMTVCPVCTLYLRPGMTLKSHLASHPKQKVIEALIKLHDVEPGRTQALYANTSTPDNNSSSHQSQNSGINQHPPPGNHSFIYQQFVTTAPPPNGYVNVNPMNMNQMNINQMNMNQMSMNQMNMNQMNMNQMNMNQMNMNQMNMNQMNMNQMNLNQMNMQNQNQYIAIPVFNPQMMGMCPPYMTYQQQQQHQMLMTSNSQQFSRYLPIEEAQIQEIDEDDKKSEASKEDCPESDNIPTIDLEEKEEIKEDESAPPVLTNEQEHAESNAPDSQEKDISNKSCQTTEENADKDPPQLMPEVVMDDDEDSKKSLDDIECTPTYLTLTNHVDGENSTSLLETASRHVHPPPSTTTMPFDVDGMNLLLNHEFMSAPIISAVEDFDYTNRDRQRDLLHIGDFHDNRDENISIDSAHIRADEHMPARGELSGQESNGSNIGWHYQHEGSSGVSTSYDLLARETWDSSEGSDLDNDTLPPYQSRDPAYKSQDSAFQSDGSVYKSQESAVIDDDMPTVSGYSAPPITYKCKSCEEIFICPKERRIHQAQVHNETSTAPKNASKRTSTSTSKHKGSSTSTKHKNNLDVTKSSSLTANSSKADNSSSKQNVVGSQLFRKNVKKLVIKPKVAKTETTNESPFDQIFSSMMKLEDVKPATENATITSSSLEPSAEAAESKIVRIVAPQVIICILCCNAITDYPTLKEHNANVHGYTADMKYKCVTCMEAFNYEPKFVQHLIVHPLECQFCGKLFHRIHNMQMHIKRHLNIRQFRCGVCDKSFLTKQKLQEHTNIHTGLSPLKCNFCDETFKRHSNLVQHRNRHHLKIKKKLKDFICFCGEVFYSKKKLAWHKEIHDNKPKACVYCSEKFIHLSSLTRHIRKAHNDRYIPDRDRAQENVECPICKGVYLRSSLEQHIKNHSGTRNFSCTICDKDFSTKWNLKLHKWTHAGRNAKPFKCEMCKGAFVRETDYVAHMNAHKQVRPYTCNYCGAQFIRKYNCQRHVREHERGKTFSCTVCSKTFHRSYYLDDHMRIHSGLRPHSCHICGKTSTTKSNHNKHIKIHHAREPVTTEN